MAGTRLFRTSVTSQRWASRSFPVPIDRHPFILFPSPAEKYKLYKKLSKAAAAAVVFSNLGQSTLSDGPPSTPPRARPPDPRPSIIRSSRRAIESAGPLSSFNPFSPTKNKGKQRESQLSTTRSNPFTTPVKVHNKRVEDTAPSFDPFQVIHPLPSQVKAPTDAVSRARKRLRGEPVSPSPSKEKRARITSQSSSPLPTFDTHSTNSDDGQRSDDGDVANSSFVNDSPVKRPAGNKSFKLLFEETIPQNMPLKSNRGKLTRSKTNPVVTGLFGDSAHMANNDSSLTVDDDNRVQIKSTRWKKPANHKSRLGKQPEQSLSEGITQERAERALLSHNEAPRRSGKHALSDSENPSTEIEPEIPNARRLPLLPPSPPPADPSSSKYKSRINEKGVSRKKAKLLQEVADDGEGSSSEGVTVKLVDTMPQKPSRSNGDDADLDDDSRLLGSHRTGVEHAHAISLEQDQARDIQVNLPEKFRHMLAISPPKTRDRKGEQVVRGLLLGGRSARYDPRRGGEIWEVGEAGDDAQGDTEGEDDWEAEPVPWEVGEL